MNQESLNYLEHMRTSQARIHLGDVRWFVTSANGWVVRGPFDKREDARAALKQLRDEAFEEDAQDDWESVA